MSSIAQFTKWLRKKQIQIEVTFAVYMFTPWEKFAFCTFLFPHRFVPDSVTKPKRRVDISNRCQKQTPSCSSSLA